MPANPPKSVTHLLNEAESGDARVIAELFDQVCAELHRLAQKRGGPLPNVTFDERLHLALTERPAVLMALNEALNQLETMNPRQAHVVECRFFAGMTIEETAHALELSEPTVGLARRTRLARTTDTRILNVCTL